LSKPTSHRSQEPVPVPADFFNLSTQAISGTSVSAVGNPADGQLRLLVQMSNATVAHAYLLAFGRFEAAGRGQDAQIALVEVLTWLDVLASKSNQVKGLRHVPLLQYVRGRCHHQLAFAIFEPGQSDSGAWCWLPWLPPADTGYEKPKRDDEYARNLAGRPVLETLKRLEGPIRKLSAG
jgi:hypothetical protein